MQHDLPPRQPRGATVGFAFETTLENESDVLESLLGALARNQLPPVAWSNLHLAAVRDDRLTQLGEAYVAVAQGKRVKATPPQVAAEFLYRAGLFFSDAANQPSRSIDFWQRALAASPTHQAAFGRLEAALGDSGQWHAQADVYIAQAHHRPRGEQADLLRKAVDILGDHPETLTVIVEQLQEIVRLDPHDAKARGQLEARLLEANRPRDLARLLEQALAGEPPPDGAAALEMHTRLLDLYAGPLAEFERTLPHVEAILAQEPDHEEARAIAQRLLEVKALAGRAAAALSLATESTGTPADVIKILMVELEHTRGPKRRDVLRRLGIARQDGTGDEAGAYEAFEQALAIDQTDEEVLQRYVALAVETGKTIDAARTLTRFGAAARDPGVRARLSAEVGDLYLRGGDPKRARASLVGVLAMPDLPPTVSLRTSRSLSTIYSSERDFRALADCLEKIAQLEPDAARRQATNEELATLAQSTLRDAGRAIMAWRRLVDTPARGRALTALQPLYEATGNQAELAFVLEERSKDEADPRAARATAFRAAQLLATLPGERARASSAWARFHERFGADREALAAWIPLLEAEGDWARLSLALEGQATLEPEDERAPLFAKIARLRLEHTDDVAGAIRAFSAALSLEPSDPASRAALEQLATAGSHRLTAAQALEPHYRNEQNRAGLLRVLDLTASGAPSAEQRMDAIEEALGIVEAAGEGPVAEWIGRGLREAVAGRQDVERWIDRLDAALGRTGRRRMAAMLSQALGALTVDSPELLVLARRGAEAHVANGDTAAGLALYRRALAFDTASQDLVERVDDLLRQQGASADRITLQRAALQHITLPRRRREVIHAIASIERFDLHDAAAAIATYEAALAEDASNAEAVDALRDLYAEVGRLGDLLALLERTLASAQEDGSRLIRAQMAEVAARQGDGARARALANELLDDPAIGEPELVVLERVADALSDQAMQRSVLGHRAALATEPAQQIAWLDRLAALELSCQEPDAAVATWKRAALAAEELGAIDEARRLYERVRSVSPADREAAHRLADLLEAAEDWAKLPELYAIILESSELASVRVATLMRHARLLAEHLDDLRGALVSAAQAFELAAESSDYQAVLSTFTMLALRGKATHIFAQAIDEAIDRNQGADPARVERRCELRMAKARVLAANREGRDTAVLAYRSILEDASASEDRIKSALHALDALMGSELPDARRDDRRWLYEWRAGRASGAEKGATFEAWAAAEESTFGEPATALALYRQALSIDPQSVRSLSAVARLCLTLGDAAGAMQTLAVLRDRTEGAARRTAELEMASTLLRKLDRPDDALASVARMLGETPDDAGALALAVDLLSIASTRDAMAKVLEDAQALARDRGSRTRILRALLDASRDGGAPVEVRGRWFETLAEIETTEGHLDLALEAVLAAALEQPDVLSFWDRAEDLARELQQPQSLGDTYQRALSLSLAPETLTALGERGVAFQEEWFDDAEGVVRILERVLAANPVADWAFERLKMAFDSAERWSDLFALYDRTIAAVDDARKATLYEDAAQIAKDFANDSDRAVTYLEKLLELRPSSHHLVASLERLYERKGAHRALVGLLDRQLSSQPIPDAQRARARIARIWLENLGEPAQALEVLEEMLSHPTDDVDPFGLLEQVVARAPSVAAEEGAPKPVRYRAAALLHDHYEKTHRDADLARMLEVELEIATDPGEREAGHRAIADHHLRLGAPETALDHLAALVLLRPSVAGYRAEMADVATRVTRFDRLADATLAAAEKADSEALRAELMVAAGDVCVAHLRDDARAAGVFLAVLALKAAPATLVLDAGRKVQGLLERAGRAWDLLDVLERLAVLEETSRERALAWTLAAKLATSLGDRARAIAAWEARLTEEDDPDALDALIDLLEQAERWNDLISALGWRARIASSTEARQRDKTRIARVRQERVDDPTAAIADWTAAEAEFGPTDESTDALCDLLEKTERWGELEERLAAAAARAELAPRKASIFARLGDVLRNRRGDLDRARTAYGHALDTDPRQPLARSGLLALARADARHGEALRLLMGALSSTDDWQEILALTSLRYEAASTDADRTAVLCESAKIAEDRGHDPGRAFELLAGAFILVPHRDDVSGELYRLATATGRWAQYAQAHEDVLGAASRETDLQPPLGDPDWRARFRRRLALVKDERLGSPAEALQILEQAAAESPANAEVAVSAISLAARLARWEVVAAALVRVSQSSGSISQEACAAAESASGTPQAWDDLTAAIEREVASRVEIERGVARDLEAKLGAWHRDRRGAPDAAQAAFARALRWDPTNADLLGALAELQRRERGMPLVDTLTRLSDARRGDVILLWEAAEVASSELRDTQLAKSILGSLLALAEARWRPGEAGSDTPAGAEDSPRATSTLESVVRWAVAELGRIHEEEGHPELRVDLLLTTAKLPWGRAEARGMMHEAARVARDVVRDSDRAIGLYEALVDSDADDGDAKTSLVRLYEAHERHGELLRLHERIVTRSVDAGERVRVRLASAQLESRLGHPDAAIALLRASLTDSPREEATVATLVGLLDQTHRLEELGALHAEQATLAEASAEPAVSVRWWVRAAEVAELRLSDTDRAIAQYRRALAHEEHTGALDALARLLATRGDHAAAAETLQRLLAVVDSGARPALVLRLVAALSAIGDGGKARATLEEACTSSPDDMTLYDRLVSMYEDLGAWEALAELHRTRATRTTDTADRLGHLRAAADLFIQRTGAPEAAIPLLEQAAILEPEDRSIKMALAEALGRAARFTEARAMLRTVIDSFAGRRPRERGMAHYHLAMLEIAMGSRQAALVELDAATKIDPGNVRILRALAELARGDGQMEKAERAYRALLVVLKRPEESVVDAPVVRSEVLLDLSTVAAEQGQSDRANELVESALDAASKSRVEARRLEQGLRGKKAFPTLVRALEARLARADADAERVEILTSLATVLDVELGHVAEALEARQKVLALTPSSTEAHEASLALARRVDGVQRYLQDVEQLAVAAERDGRRETAGALQLRLGKALEADLKDDARAYAAYERGLALAADPAVGDGAPSGQPPRSNPTVPLVVTALRAMDAVCERLGRTDERIRLLSRRVELESAEADPKAAADARYRLAELTLATPEGSVDGGLLVTQALALDRDVAHAERIVRRAVQAHSTDAGLIDLLEHLGREAGHEDVLLEALELRAELPGASADVVREASGLAARRGEAGRAEALLTKYVESGGDTDVGWAFSELASSRQAAGDIPDAIRWKARAAETAVAEDGRRLRLEIAQLTETALGDLPAAARLYEQLFDDDPTDEAAAERVLAALRKLGDADRMVTLLPRVTELARSDEERTRLRLERARLLVDPLGRREDAVSALTELVTDEPNLQEAAALLADLLEQGGRKQDLVELLGRQIDAAKDREDARQIEGLSVRRSDLVAPDDPDDARATLYSALEWAPESRSILERLVRSLDVPGMERERLEAREKLLALATAAEAEKEATEIAALRTAEGNNEAAEKALETGFRRAPGSRLLRDKLEAIFRAAGATTKLAELCVTGASALTDVAARVASLREAARLYGEASDASKVASTLAEAFVSADTDIDLAREVTAAHVKAGDLPGAIVTVTRAMDLARDNPRLQAELLLERVNLRLSAGDRMGATADLGAASKAGTPDLRRPLDEAMERARAAAEADGDATAERTLRLQIAASRAEMGDLDGARALVTELVRREPRDREALRLLARIEERGERWDAATVAYRRLMPLEDGDLAVDTALRLADACERAGRLADARGALERARTSAPGDEALRLRLVRLYEAIGAFREIGDMILAQAASVSDEDSRFVLMKRAGAYFLRDPNATTAALETLATAHQRVPSDVECTLLLADACTLGGRTEEAQALISAEIADRGNRRSPELASLYHRLARVAHSADDQEAEQRALVSALDADSQNGFVASELASLALAVGDMDSAVRALRAITLLRDASTANIPKGLAYQYLGEIAHRQGDPKRAVMLLRRALDEDPSLEVARSLLGDLRGTEG